MASFPHSRDTGAPGALMALAFIQTHPTHGEQYQAEN